MKINRTATLFALLVPAVFALSQDASPKGQDREPAVHTLHELVPMELPWLDGVSADKPTMPRAVIEVHADGSVRVAGSEPIEADDPETWKKVEAELRGVIAAWGKEKRGTTLPIQVHKGRILFRCDAGAPFRAVQRVMAIGAGMKTPIPGFDFACRDLAEAEAALARGAAVPGPTDKLAASLSYDLPMDLHGAIEEEGEGFDAAPTERSIDVLLRARVMGTRLDSMTGKPWTPELGRRFSYAKDRELQYSIGPKRFNELDKTVETLDMLSRQLRQDHPNKALRVVIDARTGMTYGEVLAVFHAAQSGKVVDEILFVGSYD